jgi:threonine dehydratase
LITLQDIDDARRSIEGEVKKTPLLRSSFLSELCQGEVYLKLENLQVTNSFKIRGALARMKRLSPEELRRGVATASAGNHAQAVAICAERLNSPAIVVVPVTTPKIKIEKIRQQKVELILHGKVYDSAEQFARQLAKERNLTFISAYNDPSVVAGQGTIGLEILEDLPNVEAIIVPIGGGGIIAGIATAAKNLRPNIEILGVQPETSPAMHHSLKEGKIMDVPVRDTIADGLAGNIEKGCITFEIIQRYVDDILLFDESTIKKMIRLLWEKERQIVEGAGAISIAPIFTTPNRFAGKRTVSVITGGNIDDTVFKEILSGGT